ncbi:hypothetical protein ACFSJW_07460 [Flavobacterium artemisiae]|uniref:Tetratricopeptide repeat-containing protein n=1 Tax=Flavobacterium artemisiae TaxID=2126556 RepID=A0ABW4HBR5_9FLAO
MAKAIKENNPIEKARANYQKALLYYKSDQNKAIDYLDSVIKYSKDSKDKYFPAAAYCEKADFLKNQFKFKEAMDNYKLAEKIALQTNVDYYYVVREYIGITKSEDLGEYNEAVEIYKECYTYYKTKDYRTEQYANDFQDIIFGIADCYKSLKKTDSSTLYNKLGFRESSITKNTRLKYLFILNEGANQLQKRNYRAGLDSINKALPHMIKYNDRKQFNFYDKDKMDNYRLHEYPEAYGYNVSSVLNTLPLKKEDYESFEKLADSLKKGGREEAVLLIQGNEMKVYLEANPRFKTLTYYNDRMQKTSLNEIKNGCKVTPLMTQQAVDTVTKRKSHHL